MGFLDKIRQKQGTTPKSPESNKDGLASFYENTIKPSLDAKEEEALDLALAAIAEKLTEEQQQTLVNTFVRLSAGVSVKSLLGF